MADNSQIQQAMQTLEHFIVNKSVLAGRSKEEGEALWERIRGSIGVLREVAYFHDTGSFWDGYEVAGYHLTDIVVWQVDHFKAYMDRHEEMNRYRLDRLFIESIETLLNMEKDPEKYLVKMRDESGTDFDQKY